MSERINCAASRTVSNPCAMPIVPMYETINFPSNAKGRRISVGPLGENRSVSTPFSTTSILLAGTPQRSMSCSRNAGVTTTIWVQRLYRNFATSPTARYKRSLGFCAPTAHIDSGHRSRISSTNGTPKNRARNQPLNPTSNCGEVAITTSGRSRNNPATHAEKQKGYVADHPFQYLRVCQRPQPCAHYIHIADAFSTMQSAKALAIFWINNSGWMVRKAG